MDIVLPLRIREQIAELPAGVKAAWYEGIDDCVGLVADAQVLWVDFKVDGVERVINAGRGLRWLTTDQAGMDRWPLKLLAARQLTLTNGAGLQSIGIAEYVVMALLAGIKGFVELTKAQSRSEWLSAPPTLDELREKRALIYGFGSIGRAIADRLRPFGVSVIGVRRHPGDEADVISDRDWESHLGSTDLLILTVPLTESTRALVGQKQLQALPGGAWVVNVARGALVDETALVATLKSGHLGGAYVDVTQSEPVPPESELWRLPNLILTPHCSWASRRIDGEAAKLFLDNLDRYRRGDQLRNVVDLQAGY